ncbi:Interleukin-1 receptor-associated kinase 4 [Cryptotermes secundus]|uniref:non-specific serine/threonine protein kinase n=2 Tax=Cryptotermes secundus TaxID=105785 RepID=A0A2J7QE73_9NEOP|nr:interleukin-1 receptor-associated kinase 4 isoform X2 [Cryptotermes secundus]PNF26888.1 Interleukin-1 receptor-associated kinase 4 [Cryptotermes secundus]PNF26890.1 Interleukin-1 receptor-associated kinase 4 [Cryptotermes secundus]PNF26892.1 Interleukin-1 receptor-associated kinase 4 [Cryptotermes secundus]
MDGSSLIRKLPPGIVYDLVHMLEIRDAWKQLMAVVPREGCESDDCYVPKYKVEHMKLIEQAGVTQRQPCAEIFLDEWRMSGRKQSDLTFLLQQLGKAELFRAADYVADLMKVPPLERPVTGPAAPVDVSEKTIEKRLANLPLKTSEPGNQYNTVEIDRAFDEMTEADGSLPSLDGPRIQAVGEVMQEEQSVFCGVTPRGESDGLGKQKTLPVDQLETLRNVSLHLDTVLPHLQYSELERFTDCFNELPLGNNGGRKLGAGTFGSVYLGILPSQKCVAVKRLHTDAVNVEKQFQNEIESLSRFRHNNLLGLLAYSCDSSTRCLVYEYMRNGSLQDRLACKDQETALQWRTRLSIGVDTARGIVHLHTTFEKPLIHRDIKSANILLDHQMVPKLGDFGLVRLGQQSNSMTMPTTTVLGTSAYMAPEAFRGDVSVKLDTFSFGVVLLELLTGLPPYDDGREGHDLVTHVEAMCEETDSINMLLDKQAGDWGQSHDTGCKEGPSVAVSLYTVALNCIEDNKRKRPNMTTVLQCLEEIIGFIT